MRGLLRQLPPPVGIGHKASLDDSRVRLRRMLLPRNAAGELPYHLSLFETLRSILEVPLPSGVPVVTDHELRTALFLKRHTPPDAGLARAFADIFDLSAVVPTERSARFGPGSAHARRSTVLRGTQVSS